MEKVMKSGIYEIVCFISGGVYVGKTYSGSGFKKRWRSERYDLRKNNGNMNLHLQRAWLKYGEDNFEFRIIEECEDEILSEREILWIKKYRELGKNLYNFTDGGEGMSGWKHSEETKKKMSEARKGKSPSEEHKKKISESLKGRKVPKETLTKVSKSISGDKNHFYGKHHTDETKARMSKSHTGKKLSNEHKRKLSESSKGNKSMTGRHHSEETKKKMSIARKGKKLSEEHKRKILESRKKYFQNKKLMESQNKQ